MFPVTPPQSTISPAPRCSFHQCNSFPLSFSEYICIDIYRSIYVSPVNMTKELSSLFSIQVWPIQMLLCMLQMLSFYNRTSDNVSVFNGLHIGHNNPPWNFFKKLKMKLFPLTEGRKELWFVFLKIKAICEGVRDSEFPNQEKPQITNEKLLECLAV